MVFELLGRSSSHGSLLAQQASLAESVTSSFLFSQIKAFSGATLSCSGVFPAMPFFSFIVFGTLGMIKMHIFAPHTAIHISGLLRAIRISDLVGAGQRHCSDHRRGKRTPTHFLAYSSLVSDNVRTTHHGLRGGIPVDSRQRWASKCLDKYLASPFTVKPMWKDTGYKK